MEFRRTCIIKRLDVDQLAIEIASIRVTSLFYVDIDVKLYRNRNNRIKWITMCDIEPECLKGGIA